MTIRGKLLKDSTEIRIVNDGGLILVQTDKAIYKKSQTGKVFTVDLLSLRGYLFYVNFIGAH